MRGYSQQKVGQIVKVLDTAGLGNVDEQDKKIKELLQVSGDILTNFI